MDKPFLTFEQQIEKLKTDYGLIIPNYNFALKALYSFSYYDLVNGYQSIYMMDNKYKNGITMELLCATHMFNKNIQGVLFKYSTYAENAFKTLLSHVIANSFSENQGKYLDIVNYKKFSNPERKKRLEDNLKTIKYICQNTNDTPTSFYRKTKNHIPPWILFRNISFSDATNLFSFLETKEKNDLFNYMNYLNTDKIDFQNKVNILLDALTLTRKFRNKIAHNLDFLTYRGSRLNKNANFFFKDSLVLESELKRTRHDIWAMVLSIVILLNNNTLIYNFLAELNSFMESDENMTSLYCDFAGIPHDFGTRISKFMKESLSDIS
ncbi:MAG: Abi family protein [Gudongella sp.]|nr:Abi family protein [Gudongella sp.]